MPNPDRLLLESSSADGYLLEDGSGVLLLDGAYRYVVLADSPVAYWRLGEPSGTNADDEVGYKDGTYTNTPTLGVAGALTGDTNTAVTFTSAQSEYVRVPVAAAFVQYLGHVSLASASTTTVISTVKTVTKGNKIIVCARTTSGAGSGFSAADNLGNIYTVDALGADGINAAILSAPVTVGGTLTTITVTHPSRTFRAANAAEFSGVGTFASSGGATLGTGTTSTWANNITIPANGLSVGQVTLDGATTAAAGAASGTPSTTVVRDGFSTDNTGYASALLHAIAGSSAVTSFSGTATHASDTWKAVGAQYNPSAVLDLGDGPLSYECWIKWSGINETEDFLTKGIRAPYFLILGTGVIGFSSYAWSDEVKSSIPIASGSWHHVVGTKGTGATWLIYIDGVDVTSIDSIADPVTVNTTDDLFIGSSSIPGLYFDGSIDEVAIYNTVLTPGQVLEHYRAGAGYVRVPYVNPMPPLIAQ